MALNFLIVFGTRPEAIKLAPVIAALNNTPEIDVRVCVTAQHRQMLDQVLRLFDIEPEHDLNLMQTDQGLTDITTAVLTGLSSLIERTRPDRVIVHGDTTTTLAASLAAYYARIPLAHVEAGLRTGNIHAPWPEEINRRVCDAIADLAFAPTEEAAQHLRRDAHGQQMIVVTGNTVVDALFHVRDRIGSEPELERMCRQALPPLQPGVRRILVTGHRRENFGAGIRGICQALAELAERTGLDIVYPVHLNPNVQGPVHELLGGHPRIHLLPPLDYAPFVYAMQQADLILTDSGGIQEEAPSLGKPVLVMRDVTERPEAVAAGTVRLVGSNAEKIVGETLRLLEDDSAYAQMSRAHNPYGDGLASGRILDALLKAHRMP